MIQVKLFTSRTVDDLELQINVFLLDCPNVKNILVSATNSLVATITYEVA